MLKRLLDYNSAENVWLRTNRTKAIVYGVIINSAVFGVVGKVIHKSWKK